VDVVPRRCRDATHLEGASVPFELGSDPAITAANRMSISQRQHPRKTPPCLGNIQNQEGGGGTDLSLPVTTGDRVTAKGAGVAAIVGTTVLAPTGPGGDRSAVGAGLLAKSGAGVDGPARGIGARESARPETKHHGRCVGSTEHEVRTKMKETRIKTSQTFYEFRGLEAL